jgi:hypothetical protein
MSNGAFRPHALIQAVFACEICLYSAHCIRRSLHSSMHLHKVRDLQEHGLAQQTSPKCVERFENVSYNPYNNEGLQMLNCQMIEETASI